MGFGWFVPQTKENGAEICSSSKGDERCYGRPWRKPFWRVFIIPLQGTIGFLNGNIHEAGNGTAEAERNATHVFFPHCPRKPVRSCNYLLLGGTIVNRTYGAHKNHYISLFLLLISVIGPI